MNQPLTKEAVTQNINREFVTVSETTLPNGTVVPSFLVGKYHCSKNSDGALAIDPANKPWSRMDYNDARIACADAGLALITELQYLAIAWQICQHDINWKGGKVGEGKIYQGLHKDNVDEAQDGNYESTDKEERRWHELSNSERVYDFSGNIYSWVFDDVQGDENGIIAKTFTAESPSLSTAPYPSMEKGTGWQPSAGSDWSGDALVRGGYWSSFGYAGVFILDDGWADREYGIIGFRCTKSL